MGGRFLSLNILFEYKLGVVELYLSSELSYQEPALREGIYNPVLIHKWVNNFRVAGPEALRPRKKDERKHCIHLIEKQTC